MACRGSLQRACREPAESLQRACRKPAGSLRQPELVAAATHQPESSKSARVTSETAAVAPSCELAVLRRTREGGHRDLPRVGGEHGEFALREARTGRRQNLFAKRSSLPSRRARAQEAPQGDAAWRSRARAGRASGGLAWRTRTASGLCRAHGAPAGRRARPSRPAGADLDLQSQCAARWRGTGET